MSSHCLIQGFAPESMCLSSHDYTCVLASCGASTNEELGEICVRVCVNVRTVHQ